MHSTTRLIELSDTYYTEGAIGLSPYRKRYQTTQVHSVETVRCQDLIVQQVMENLFK